jgi:hypothetical protein
MAHMGTWQDLVSELDRWSDLGEPATFWWRDDDATAHTKELDVLLGHAEGIPLALAVIPRLARSDLADRIHPLRSVVVLQHGWSHINHAADGLSEYPASRPMEHVAEELTAGREKLAEHFGPQLAPVFVPPWHGFDARFLPLLPEIGIKFISQKGPDAPSIAADGVRQVNAHAAPIKWTSPASYGEDEEYLSQLLEHLSGRRLGRYDRALPTGLLTHHLAQNDDSYRFVARLIEVIANHPSATWLAANELFHTAWGTATEDRW